MATQRSESQIIRIGLIADEPIRMAGLASVFEQPAEAGRPQLVPVIGTATEFLAKEAPDYLVVDLHSSGFEVLDKIHRSRPDVRLIVIGPKGDDELVLTAIVAGARAFLEPNAGPEIVRQAVEIVTSGSIWAPRRLLSKLIDRLLRTPETVQNASTPELTARERQVLELILLARSNREIAEQLGIEERTVKAYVARLMRKAGADNRVKLSLSPLGKSFRLRENKAKDVG